MPLHQPCSSRGFLVAVLAAILSAFTAQAALANDVTNPPPPIAADQVAPDALPAIAQGDSLTALALPDGCSIGDGSCALIVHEQAGVPVALTGDAAAQAEAEAAALAAMPAPAATARRAQHIRFIVLKRTHRTTHRSRGRAHAAGYVGVHYTDAAYSVCSIVCSAWHARASERFYWDGTKAWAGPNSWVDCSNRGGIGYSVDVSFCGFRGPNPAYYGSGSYLPGNADYTVNFLSSVGGQAYHYVHFHNYGDGYVGFHNG